MINYYEVLEIQPESDSDEIKRSFRRLAKKYHPDHNIVAGFQVGRGEDAGDPQSV